MRTETEPGPAEVMFDRGARALNARRFAEAEDAFRASLDSCWDSGSATERRACVNLVTVLLVQNRIYEAFVLAWRARDLWAAAGEPRGVCLAWRHIAAFYMLTGDIPRLEEATDETEALLGHLPERLLPQIRMNVAIFRAVVARRRGRPEDALRYCQEAEDAAASDEFRIYALEQRSSLFLEAGRHQEARDLAAVAIEKIVWDTAQRFRLEDTLIRCSFYLEGRGPAMKRARAFLDRLEAEPASLLGTGARMRIGERMAVWLAEEPGDGEQSLRAFEIAGRAALERVREVEDFRRQFPRLRVRTQGVAEILDDVRARYRAEHEGLLRHLSEKLGELVMYPPPTPPGQRSPEPVVCVCAWCRRARGPETIWVALADYVPPPSGFHVSHGICEDCLAETSAARSS